MKKKIVFFLFLIFFVPFMKVHAALPRDFGVISGETIWLGWTEFESGDIGAKNKGYASVGDNKYAYGRYQFDLRYDTFKLFIKEIYQTNQQMYSELEPYINAQTSVLRSNRNTIATLWRTYASNGDSRFIDLQDEIAFEQYYLPTKNALLTVGIDLNDFGPVIKGTVWSVAIRDGTLYTSAPSSNTYKALVNTYEEGISDEEYLNKIMAAMAVNHPSTNQRVRWESTQKTAAVSAMGVEDRAHTYQTSGIGGSLGGLLSDPYKKLNLLTDETSCKQTFYNSNGELNQIGKLIEDVFFLIKLATPILVILLTTMDYFQALAKDEEKKIHSKTLKRLGIGVIIFMLPFLLELLFKMFGLYEISDCGIL